MELCTFNDLINVVEGIEKTLREITDMLVEKKQKLLEAKSFFSGFQGSLPPEAMTFSPKGIDSLVPGQTALVKEVIPASRFQNRKQIRSRKPDWKKDVFNVLNGKQLKLSQIFDLMHAQKIVAFHGVAGERKERIRLKVALYKLKRDGYVKQVSDEYDADWIWVGGAIV
jgi:hypothetical protein